MRRLLFGLALMVSAVFVLAACGGDDPTPTPAPTPTAATAAPTPTALPAWQISWNETLAAAKQEGRVDVWVGGGGVAARNFLEGAFEAAYPDIDVVLFQAARSSERDSRFLQEWQAGVASVDLFNGGSSGGDGRLKPAGALQPIKPFLIHPDVGPDNWANGHLYVDIEENYMLMGGAAATPALAVADGVDVSKLTHWEDLLDPEWNGSIIMNDPRTSGNGAARAGYWFCAPDPKCFNAPMRGFMEKLYKNTGIQLSDDDRVNLDQIISGKKKILISPANDELAELKAVGVTPNLVRSLKLPDNSDLDQISDSPGILFVPNIDIPHPNAATVYINWFYSKEGQQAMIDIRTQPSTRKDVDNSALPDNVIPLAPAFSVNQTISELNKEGGIREKVNEWIP